MVCNITNKQPLVVFFVKFFVKLLSMRVALSDVILLGFVIDWNKDMEDILSMNASVTLCLFGFKRSMLKCPQMNMGLLLTAENTFSISSLKVSTLDPGDPETQLIIMLFSFYY